MSKCFLIDLIFPSLFLLQVYSHLGCCRLKTKLTEHEFYKLISGSAVGNSVYTPRASLRKTRNTSVQVIYLFLSKLTMILTLFLATAGDQRPGFDRMQLHEEKQHIQGAEPLHQAHALLVPQLEPHKNIFSLTDNPQQVSSSLPFFFLLSPHVIIPSHPMDTRPPSSPGPGGLLRQGCGWDVTRGPTGYRESLPPSERRH